MSKPSVFISYSHKDKEWEEKFRPHLKMLENNSNIVFWDDRKINPGQEWYDEIKFEMSKAAVAVCFVSADYLASDFVLKEEIPYLLERRKENGMEIIPVLLRPCLWKAVRWLKKLQMLPGEGKSISVDFKEDYDVPFTEIAERIYEIIDTPDYIPPAACEELYAPPEKIDIFRLPDTGSRLFGREKELTLLDDAWKSDTQNIISFIAWGGVGKSTLINKWLEYMKEDNYKEAERVFAWSFYSQGTNERVSSADLFISKALEWFGDKNPEEGSARDKGIRLARLICEKKTILVLDGMEPLQSSHKFEEGKIKDPALSALLVSLAKNNNGLCIVSSREWIKDIEKFKDSAPQINLEKISKEAGRALLRVGGVKGSDDQLENAVEHFGNHALAIKLIPMFLQNKQDHHIADAMKIPDIDIADERGRHPRRIIEEIYKNLKGSPEHDIVKIMGFFEKPADIEAVEAIIEEPVIKGLTDNVVNNNEAQILEAIQNLRDLKLIAKKSKHRPNTLDCHPLIREHFSEKLENENKESWIDANARLFEYYKNKPDKEFPDTLEEMEPLFAAVMHGCRAGKYEEAYINVLWKRLKRDKSHYYTKKLGAYGVDLSCLSNFFEILWSKPVDALPDYDKAIVLSLAGSDLLSLGRLIEAVQPMKSDLKGALELNDIAGAAIASNNISELHMYLGDLKTAEEYSEHAVKYADQARDSWSRIGRRTMHAEVLHNMGDFNKAKEVFMAAEGIIHSLHYKYLFSTWGFRLNNLLLDNGEYEEVITRAKTTMKDAVKSGNVFDVPHEHLSLGKALILKAVDRNTGDFNEAEEFLNKAVEGFRVASDLSRAPWSLIARAGLFRLKKQFDKSWIDLDEVLEIAGNQMRLHLTDYYLEAARVLKAQIEDGKGNDEFSVMEFGVEKKVSADQISKMYKMHVAQAKELIETTGYHRRDEELKAL